MNSVLQQYYEYYDIVNSQQRMQHYQLSGSHLGRICKNTMKLVGGMENFDLSFWSQERCRNHSATAPLLSWLSI